MTCRPSATRSVRHDREPNISRPALPLGQKAFYHMISKCWKFHNFIPTLIGRTYIKEKGTHERTTEKILRKKPFFSE